MVDFSQHLASILLDYIVIVGGLGNLHVTVAEDFEKKLPVGYKRCFSMVYISGSVKTELMWNQVGVDYLIVNVIV